MASAAIHFRSLSGQTEADNWSCSCKTIQKLFYWSVDYYLKPASGTMIKRTETGIVRAQDINEAKSLLSHSVQTSFSKNLVVREIPEKINVYSFSYKDIKLKPAKTKE